MAESRQDLHSYETFIAVADDCPATAGEAPKARDGVRTAAQVHYEMVCLSPYEFTQPQVLFAAELAKKGLDPAQHPEGGATWEAFYAKGQPCLRASALGKRYGWGVHFNEEAKVAGYAVDSAEYTRLVGDPAVAHTRAMRTRRA